MARYELADPFSEGGAAAAGAAPWGTIATAVDGGYRIRGKKIFASLAGAADYYGVLCTFCLLYTSPSPRD